LNASILGSRELAQGELALALIVILSGCSLGMKLNVWTDRELDRRRKPELIAQLTGAYAWTRILVVGEGLALAASTMLIWYVGDRGRAEWLLLFIFLFNLYSFNFFIPQRGEATRFKIYWWGNLITAGGGYFALWMSGLGGVHASHELVVFAFFCAASEYAMFLGECATDADEENCHELRTLPALIGRRGTVTVALAASVVLALTWIAWGRRIVSPLLQVAELRLAGHWYVAFAVTTCLLLFVRARTAHRPDVWDRRIDSCFWVLRLGLLAILLFKKVNA
jgi:4-hydroxybenzoate polyprenyltransferase